MAGHELATWRFAGRWWEVAPQSEVCRYIDSQGVLRTEITELEPLCDPSRLTIKSYQPNHTDDLDIQLRPRKSRDEKVGRACGYVADSCAVTGYQRALSYVPLHVLSGYSFGRSVLLAEEIPRLAAKAGLPGVAIADVMALTGAHELDKQCGVHGIKPLIGTSIEMPEGGEIVLLARNISGWRSLSRLVSDCHLEEPRLYPLASWQRLHKHHEGLLCLTGGDVGPLDRLLAGGNNEAAATLVDRLVALYGKNHVFLEVDRACLPWSRLVESRLRVLGADKDIRLVAGGSVTHRRRSHFPAQDVLACSQTLCLVDEVVGRKERRHESQVQANLTPFRSFNAERFFKTADEMAKLFGDAPELLKATHHVASLCESGILPGQTRLPSLYEDPKAALRQLVFEGAEVWHRKVTPNLRARLTLEVDRFCELGYSEHVLLAHDMCRWARSEGILFSGRGSAVDSATMYCLGISRIDAFAHRLHFERFLPSDGSKKPDIDIDFEAKRRANVHGYLIQKYGVDHVAGISAIGSFRTRGILREVGKVLGLTDEAISAVTKHLHGGVQPGTLFDALEKRPELRKLNVSKERLRWVFKLAEVLRDTPRNIRAHSSGIVVSRDPIADTTPVQWSGGGQGGVLDRITQWDKRSAKRCFIKFDVLCLRGQDVLSGTQARLREDDAGFSVDMVDADDPEIFRAMRSSQTVGIPQSASPAMTQAHARIRTNNLTDASLVQAGIRPGVGGAVKLNTLIARRHGEHYAFEHPDFERILGHTYGIVVFQEQIDQLLETFCGFSSGGAEDIREKIHEKRHQDYGQSIKELLIKQIIGRGYSPEVAEVAFDTIASFKGYGFAQGHALAFAEISARSVWCQQNFPAPYFAALLDAQPAGYYGPSTLVNEARIRGLVILPPDVNRSSEQFLVEDIRSNEDPKIVVPQGAVRIDLGSIGGLSKPTRKRIIESAPFTSFADFMGRATPARDEVEQLVLCGALDGLHANRRALLWAMEPTLEYAAATRAVGGLPLTHAEPEIVDVADFSLAEKALYERQILGLDVRCHLMAWERKRVAAKGGITSSEAKSLSDRAPAMMVGNPIRLRFPPTPTGKRVVFFDLEDETGIVNVTCFDDVYQKCGDALVLNPYVVVFGRAQIRDGYVAFLADRIIPYHPVILTRTDQSIGLSEAPLKIADFLVG